MAQLHSELQKSVKKLFELYGWVVIENKKGQSARNYNSGEKGISDLLAVKPFNEVIWIEIKTPNDIQKPDQKIFQEKVEGKGHKYYLVYDIDTTAKIIDLNDKKKTSMRGKILTHSK